MNYSEMREKALDRMYSQAEEVKTVMVECWARENGFSDVYFNNYEEAKQWIEENVNTNWKLRISFYKFEKKSSEQLEQLMDDLKKGSSNAIIRNLSKLNEEVGIPILKIILQAVAINFLITLGVGIGLNIANSRAHEWAINQIEGIDLTSSIDFQIDIPIGFLQDFANSASQSIENFAIDKISGVEDAVKNFLTSISDGLFSTFKDSTIPSIQHVTTIVVAFLQAKGLLKDAKKGIEKRGLIKENGRLKNENRRLTKEKENLQRQLESEFYKNMELSSSNENQYKIEDKNARPIKSMEQLHQMEYIVSEMQSFFAEKGIKIPEIAGKCNSIIDYGKSLRETMIKEKYPKEVQDEIMAYLQFYSNNIGKINKELQMGKPYIFTGIRDNIEYGISRTAKGAENMVYTMIAYVKSIIHGKNRISQDDINQLPVDEQKQKQEPGQE